MGIMLDEQQLTYKMNTARDLYDQNKVLHALQVYLSILEDNPDYFPAIIKITEIYQVLGNIEPAIELLKEQIEENPDNKELRIFYGQFLFNNKKWEQVVEVLSYILPEEEPAISFFTGYSYFMLKDYELAKHNFLNFINHQEHTGLIHEAYLYLSKIYIELNNFERALVYAKKIESIYNDFWELSFMLAKIYYNLDMYAHGVGPIEKAIKLNPSEPLVYEWGGKIYLKIHEYIKAENNFLKCIEMNENISAEAYNNLAEAYYNNGKFSEALSYYELALRIEPDNKIASVGKENVLRIPNINIILDGNAQG